jgi:hypothetical protein
MHLIKTIALACAWLAVLTPSTVRAQTTSRVVVGQIVDSMTGVPLANALVQLDSTTDSAVSDSSGKFRFTSQSLVRSRALRIRRLGYQQGLLRLSQQMVGDSIDVGRIALVSQVVPLFDRIPECRELKGIAPPLRKDSIVEWLQVHRTLTGAESTWLCRVKIGSGSPANQHALQ